MTSYPPWLPKALLSIVASLTAVAAVLGVSLYMVATSPVRLEALSAAQRQQLVGETNKIVPPIYQPFPLAGPMLFYVMTPYTRYVGVFGATFTTNDLGFRTVPTSSKPEGTRRIVVVGDSWTFGQGVQYEDAFPSQLERLLNRRGNKWQVYNMGIPGWNTANEIAALRTLFSRLNPDVVVFCPTSNDIDDSYDVWNGHLVTRGLAFGPGFRSSYAYESRWIQAFQSLQTATDFLKEHGVESFIYFLAEWRGLAPYYAKLSGLRASYTVVPSKYLDAKYRLSPDADPGQHASPEGHRLIAGYLYNALVDQHIVAELETNSGDQRVVFPGQTFDTAAVEAEFRSWRQLANRSEFIPLNDGFVAREGVFSVPASPTARTVYVRLKLVDDPGLYPLRVEIQLESSEKASAVTVFDRFAPDPQAIEIAKPRSLDAYSTIEVHVIADHVVVPKDLTPISMHRPTFEVR